MEMTAKFKWNLKVLDERLFVNFGELHCHVAVLVWLTV